MTYFVRLALSVFLLLVLSGCVLPDNTVWEVTPQGANERAFVRGAILMCRAEAEQQRPRGVPDNEEMLSFYCLIRAGQLALDAGMLPPPQRIPVRRMPVEPL